MLTFLYTYLVDYPRYIWHKYIWHKYIWRSPFSLWMRWSLDEQTKKELLQNPGITRVFGITWVNGKDEE